MIKTALSSAAMLGATPDMILQTAIQADVQAIEWSVDGFLEPGDIEAATELMLHTLRAGLSVASYASLFRVGLHSMERFDQLLATARALQSPLLRVWSAPLDLSSVQEGETAEESFMATASSLGDKAGEEGITLCFSLARDSLLSDYQQAASLFAALDHPFVKLSWEPAQELSFDASMELFGQLHGQVGLVVARSLGPDGRVRSLCERDEDWSLYLDAFDEQGGSPDMARYVVIRAFKDKQPENLRSDARMIRYYSEQLRRYRRRRIYC